MLILGRDKSFLRAYWLAEQGLAPKRVLLALVPLLIIFLLKHINQIFENKGEKNMEKKKKTFDALNVIFNTIINLSFNLAGGALLANAF
jgi:hypothetical protein